MLRTTVGEVASGGATLTIAVVGLALAVASLAWQAATFVLTAPRIKLELLWGTIGPNGALLGPVSVELPRLNENYVGPTEEVLAVRVTNAGRMPGSVDRLQVVFESGMRFFDPAFFPYQSLPYRLEPYASETWFVPMKMLQAMVTAAHETSVSDDRIHQRAWFWAEPAYGKAKRTKDSIVLQGA